jgi:hypothetical protein
MNSASWAANVLATRLQPAVRLVATQRDLWDKLALGVAIAAGLTAIVGFAFWIARQRRRPEVDFYWRIAKCGDISCLEDWHQDIEPEIEVGSTIIVEASILNIGDAIGERTLANFVVPGCFELERYPVPDGPSLEGGNDIAGQLPDDWVKFVAPERALFVGMAWQLRFAITVTEDPGAHGARFLMAVDEERFNATGRRWGPSMLAGGYPSAARYGTTWPPGRPRRRVGWLSVGSRDGNRVYCHLGERKSTRDIKVVPRASSPGAS